MVKMYMKGDTIETEQFSTTGQCRQEGGLVPPFFLVTVQKV